MEHIAEPDIAPDDLVGRALAGQQPHPGPVVGIPSERERRFLAEREVQIDRDRQVVDHGVVLGERHVVDHRHARQRHIDRLAHSTVGAHHDVLDVIEQVLPRIADRVQLAAAGIQLRMRRESGFQRPGEIVATHCLQLVADLHRHHARFDERPRRAGKAPDARIRREVERADRPRHRRFAQRLHHVLATYPTVAVPLGAAAPQPHPVHHSRADKPVARRRIAGRDRVRPVAQVTAFERRGNLTDHVKVERGDLFGHGSEVALAVGVLRLGFGGVCHCWLPDWWAARSMWRPITLRVTVATSSCSRP